MSSGEQIDTHRYIVQSGCVQELKSNQVQQEILEGKYSTSTDEGFNRLAKGLTRKVPELGKEVIKEKLQQVWRKAKGGKSSANRIFTYGVIKCLAESEKVMEVMAKFYTKVIQLSKIKDVILKLSLFYFQNIMLSDVA